MHPAAIAATRLTGRVGKARTRHLLDEIYRELRKAAVESG